jgi:hypothetical protein
MSRRAHLMSRVRAWAGASTDFPLRRSAVWAVALVVLVMVGGATTLAAQADPAGSGTGLLSAIDVADSKGIRVSQYELSIDSGNILDTTKVWLSLRLMTAWEIYRYGVGLVAYVFDWTLSMTWLTAIITPLDAAARQIRDQVISPIGLAGVMLLISAVVGSIKIVYGRTGRGIFDILSAAAVAAAVAVLLVSPVAAVTGEPLTKVRNAGLGVAAMIDGRNIGDTDINATPDAAQLKPAPVLVDAFIRPAHGLINYGVNFTDDQRCTPAYDAALKAGPYFDMGSDDQRDKVASCDKTLGEYAEKQSVYVASAGLGLFMLTGALVGATVLTGCVLLFIAVMMLGWSLLKLVITGVIGIGPGDTRGPMIRNALTALTSLLYVGTSTIVLALVLVLIKNAFATDVGNPMARFLLVDVILIGGLIIVIQTSAAHRRGAQAWTDKAMAKFQQSTPKPTIGSRVGTWLKAPAGGEAAKYGGLGGDYGPALGGAGGVGGYGAAGSPFGLRRMARPITHSNAFQLARLGVIAGATGGGAALVAGKTVNRAVAGVAAHSVTGTVAGARTLAVAAATGAHWAGVGVRHTADAAQRVVATHRAVRAGHAGPAGPAGQTGQAGSAGGTPDPRITQARAYLRRGAVSVAADAALALGPARRPQPQQGTSTPAAQHRTEDPQRSAQRAAAERTLTRPAASASSAAAPTVRAAAPAAPAIPPRRPATARPVITVESAATAAERVQHLVQPTEGSRGKRGPDRPMRR